MGTAALDTPSLPTDTTWGVPDVELDVRALRRYRGFLRVALATGEWLSGLLAIAILVAAVWMVTMTNFENDVFSDGTANSCVLNGSTGEIVNVR